MTITQQVILFAAKNLGQLPGSVLDHNSLLGLGRDILLGLEGEGFDLVRMGAGWQCQVLNSGRVFGVEVQSGIKGCRQIE